ncbi:sugar nucleotide-binding protein [Candidatus Pelagibacter sp.]|nr:sugar nucleotide-binding protein [Candidatus Pelagibacter sp.]
MNLKEYNKMEKKILVTGGDGRFSKIFKKKNKSLKLIFTSKKQCNILSIKSIEKIVKKIKPKIIIHCAGLSRPMEIHEKNISKSIDLNIIGTANITKVCEKNNIKLIYFSTGYVYEGTKGNYSEKDPVKPFNNYGLSKLGGECAVSMYKNSLILRITMTEKPFPYETAYTNLKSNFMFHEELIKILPKIIKKKGIINIGGKSQSVFQFAKKFNKKVKKIKASTKIKLPLNQTMNLLKLKKILN